MDTVDGFPDAGTVKKSEIAEEGTRSTPRQEVLRCAWRLTPWACTGTDALRGGAIHDFGGQRSPQVSNEAFSASATDGHLQQQKSQAAAGIPPTDVGKRSAQ